MSSVSFIKTLSRLFRPSVGRIALGMALLVVLGCGAQKRAEDALQKATDEAVRAINEAIDGLQNTSADWQRVLQELEGKLNSQLQSDIRNEVSNLISRTIAQSGSEFRCDADFINKRLQEDLIAIKAKIFKQTVPPPMPAMCNVVPIALDASVVPDRVKQLEFYGYNFDHIDNLKVVLVNSDDSSKDVTSSLNRPTPYAMTLAFGANGVHLDQRSMRFVMSWRGIEISAVSVIQPQAIPPVCASNTVQVFQTETQKNIGPFIPPKVGAGDLDFGGNGPFVRASVDLIGAPTVLTARVYMDARETGGDKTEAEGWKDYPLYVPPQGWRIDHVDGVYHSTISYTDSNLIPDSFNMGPADLVAEYILQGDNEGDDAGLKTSVRLRFNPIVLTITQVGNCVPGPAVRKVINSELLSSLVKSSLGARAAQEEVQHNANLAAIKKTLVIH